MKTILAVFATVLASLAIFELLILVTPVSAVTTPPECAAMTFDNTIVAAGPNMIINGTAQRDLIYAQGGDIVNGKAGADCIVSGGRSVIKGGDGADVILGGVGDINKGENGADKIVGQRLSVVDGGSGTDTCTIPDMSSLMKNCEL